MADLKHELEKLQDSNSNQAKPNDYYVKGKAQHGLEPRQKSIAILVLCVLVFVILLLIVGLIVLGVQLHAAKKPKPSVCLTVDCINTVSDLMDSVDPTVDPCDDFYQYACGKWEQNNPIPIDKTTWTQMSVLREKNEKIMRKLITLKEIRAQYTKIEALRKVFMSYDVCMNEEQIKKLGAKPLNNLIESMGSCPGLNDSWGGSSWNFTKTLSLMYKDYWTWAFFTTMVSPSKANMSVVEIVLYSGALTLRSSRYNSTTEANIKVKKAYNKYMVDIFTLLGRSTNQSMEMAESVFRVEKQIALLLASTKEEDKASSTKEQRASIRTLSPHGNETLDWLKFFEIAFNGTGFIPTMDLKVRLDSLKYYLELQKLISDTPKGDLANYMMWRLIQEHVTLLSTPFVKARKEFYKVFGGSSSSSSSVARWTTCVMETKSYFGFAIGRMFVEEAFRNRSKEEAIEMVEDIKNVFIADFDTVDWMDSETRAAARKKAETMNENIGYPDWILDDKKLSAKYSMITVGNESYFDNMISISKVEMFKILKQINEPMDRKRWNIFPTTVNAQYISIFNSIGLPAGILQPPFFKNTYPMSVNFGGIGNIIGHEMTHGFDDSGRKYNERGNKVKWWTNSSIEAFNERAKCFQNVYSNYTFMGKNLDGETVLGEAIADNAGTKLSYQAYKVWLNDHGEDPRLPGIKLTHDQIFFLSYAHIFCGSYTKSAAERIMAMSAHPINPLRINGVMSNSEEFAKAFSCPANSPMNPPEKCKMW